MIRKIMVPFCIMFLFACVHVETPLRKSEQQLAISSIFIEDITIDDSSTYAFTPLQSDEDGERYPKVTATIEDLLAIRSIKQVAPSDNPTFLVGYVLRREDEQLDDQLAQTFGVDPGLPDLPNLDKGTMLVFVLDGTDKRFLWRSAAQGFIMDGNSDEERKHRVEQLVHAIFGQFVNK